MDTAQGTRKPFKIPPKMIPVLRQAADRGLERASDNSGYWTNEIRTDVLTAARTYDLFHYGTPSVADVAELADKAIGWTERPDAMPDTIDRFGPVHDQLITLRNLIVLRDDALRYLGRPVPDEASDEAGA